MLWKFAFSWFCMTSACCTISLCNHSSFGSFLVWSETGSTWYVGHELAYCTSPGWWWWWWWWWMRSSRWNENWQEKPKYSEKTCPRATLSTTNPTRPDLGSNPGRRGGKPATNRLSYGTALCNQALCNSQTAVNVENLPVVRRILFCRHCWLVSERVSWKAACEEKTRRLVWNRRQPGSY
jgi:hypothetical protein